MVSILSLWAPILVAAVLVFGASSVIHMLMPYHRKDFKKVDDEESVMDSLRALDIPPGDYIMPFAGGPEGMRSEAFIEKVKKGPIAMITVMPEGAWLNMGPQLAQWFVYVVLVSCVAGYAAGLGLDAGAEYRTVFRMVSTVAFACYSMALMQNSIWHHRNGRQTLTTMFDGLVYALVTGGAFGWLWPS